MTTNTTLNGEWMAVIDEKTKVLFREIASLRAWAEAAGADETFIEEITSPYHRLMRSIYHDDIPLAEALENSDLLIHYEGPAVKTDSPRISVIAAIFADVRKRVGSVAYAIANVAGKKTLLPKEIDLGLAGYARGSLYVGFKLPDPSEMEDKDGNPNLLGENDPLYRATKEAIRTIGQVVRHVATGTSKAEIEAQIPDPKIRDTAFAAVEHLAPTGRKGIFSVSITGREMEDRSFHELTCNTRQEITAFIEHPVKSSEIAQFEGVVREIDLDLRRFELRRIVANAIEEIRCIYSSEYDGKARDWLNKSMSVLGRVDRGSDTKPRLLEVHEIGERGVQYNQNSLGLAE